MSKIISTLLIVIFFISGGYYIYDTYIVRCHYPIDYSIGGIDSRFSITELKFASVIMEAEKIWESASGINFFNFKINSDFKINLVYDERQETSSLAKESEQQLEGTGSTYNLILNQYKSAKAEYESRLGSYNLTLSNYEKRLDEYNRNVDFYNKRGGAPKKEYDELQKEAEILYGISQNLAKERENLNNMARELNILGENLNSLAKKFNIEVDIHNERFGEAREFDQADFKGDSINVYQFETLADLKLVLAHELGHALGIEHVENPKSIMYYLMEKQDINNPSLSREDLAALKEVCKI